MGERVTVEQKRDLLNTVHSARHPQSVPQSKLERVLKRLSTLLATIGQIAVADLRSERGITVDFGDNRFDLGGPHASRIHPAHAGSPSIIHGHVVFLERLKDDDLSESECGAGPRDNPA
jgi:hypothetical protein